MVGCGRTPAPGTESDPLKSPTAAVDLSELEIDALQKRLQDGTLTSRRLTQWYLDRVAAIDDAGPMLNAVIAINPDAMAIADSLDTERRAGRVRGPLHGIPMLIKDNIDTADRMPTTAGSLALAGSTRMRDAFVVAAAARGRRGHPRQDQPERVGQFPLELRSTSGWSAAAGRRAIPTCSTAIPCGSSSGSGVGRRRRTCAAVAIGTETDGSIVCPGSVNGIVGFKPTVGLVSRGGIIPIAHSQDTAGPMARTVADAAILLDAIAGTDARTPPRRMPTRRSELSRRTRECNPHRSPHRHRTEHRRR